MARTDFLVVDANVAIAAATTPQGFDLFRGIRLVGPPLLASEFRSTLHLALWRREIRRENADRALAAMFESANVEFVDHPRLGTEAWTIAEQLGWARTYDAEYVALARILDCRLMTRDMGIRRGADRLGLVITPQEFLAQR